MQINPAVRSIFDFRYEDFAADRLRPAPAHQGRGGGVNERGAHRLRRRRRRERRDRPRRPAALAAAVRPQAISPRSPWASPSSWAGKTYQSIGKAARRPRQHRRHARCRLHRPDGAIVAHDFEDGTRVGTAAARHDARRRRDRGHRRRRHLRARRCPSPTASTRPWCTGTPDGDTASAPGRSGGVAGDVARGAAAGAARRICARFRRARAQRQVKLANRWL